MTKNPYTFLGHSRSTGAGNGSRMLLQESAEAIVAVPMQAAKGRTQHEDPRPWRLDRVARQQRLSDYETREGSGTKGRDGIPTLARGAPQVPSGAKVHDGDADPPSLLARALHPDNLQTAIENVKKNKGAPGVDDMTTAEFPAWWDQHGASITAKLLAGKYRPSPLRRVLIPKPDGKGVRLLGIPTVLDRVIQQAILQIVQPLVDPSFSDHSYGFRPERSAHQAVRQAKQYIESGYDWVVDLDLEKFFDQVNHDVLMDRVSKRLQDRDLLALIRRYLRAGVMQNGILSASEMGTPQGAPLSPILANILLDDLDRELERRGHRFVRYADDVSIYVQSEASGKRVLASVSRFLEHKLQLRVNQDKSAVDRAWKRMLLGFSFVKRRDGSIGVSLAKRSIARFRARVRLLTGKWARGHSMGEVVAGLNRYLVGWFGYFQLVEFESKFEGLDGWLRRRLRRLVWRQWVRPRTRFRELVARGVSEKMAAHMAWSSKGPWRLSRSQATHRALPNRWFSDELGLFELLAASRQRGPLDVL